MSTNTTTITTKSGKKTAPLPSTPSTHRNTEVATIDKSSASLTAQPMSITLASLQEMMIKMQESIDRNYEALSGNMGAMNEDIKIDIKKIDDRVGRLDERLGKIESMQETLTLNTEKIKKIEEQTERMETRLQFAEGRTEYLNKNLEEAIINLELEKSAFFLRIQNLTEMNDENLPQIIAGILANTTNKTPQELIQEIDEIYRINTSYARRHKLPREIHIRFTKRTIRDEIYNFSKENTITYMGKEILILRQIPRRVREKRRPYQFLSAKLNRHKIPFRWLVPEGMLISVADKKYKITSEDDAKDFYDQIIRDFDEKNVKDGDDKNKETTEELSSEESVLERETRHKPLQEQYGRDRPTTRAQAEAQKERRKELTK